MSYNGISYFLELGDLVALGVLHLMYRPGLPSSEHFENMAQGWFLILHAVVGNCVEEYFSHSVLRVASRSWPYKVVAPEICQFRGRHYV